MCKCEYAGVQVNSTRVLYIVQQSLHSFTQKECTCKLVQVFLYNRIITAVMVQCMYICSPLCGKFKGTTTAAIFTRAAACILVYTRTVVRHRIFFVMFYIPQIGKFLLLNIFHQLLRWRKLNTQKFLTCTFNFATWPRGEN